MRVLVVNAGSATLKLRVVDPGGTVAGDVHVDAWAGDHPTPALDAILERSGPVDAVGHRVVHGGRDFTDAVVVDDGVEARIEALSSLAPLHQPRALAAMRAARTALPALPHVACFDTAFHATMPDAARTYALPAAWRARWGLGRFGFHGLSHSWAARRAAELLGQPPRALRTVTCHLGAGASLCAVVDGRSVDTTMGFTPLDGLVMATRSGAVDPGLVVWLTTAGGLSPSEVGDGLERHAGLAGLGGGSGDMREVLARRMAGDAEARFAFDVYVHRLRREIAAMAAAAGGLDVLVFTGGVGEHAPPVRAAAAEGLEFLGVGLDAAANEQAEADAVIGAPGAPVATVVVTAREDLEIARDVRRLAASDG